MREEAMFSAPRLSAKNMVLISGACNALIDKRAPWACRVKLLIR